MGKLVASKVGSMEGRLVRTAEGVRVGRRVRTGALLGSMDGPEGRQVGKEAG